MNDLAYAQLVLSQTVKDLDDLIGKFPGFKDEGEKRKASCQFGAKILQLYQTYQAEPVDLPALSD